MLQSCDNDLEKKQYLKTLNVKLKKRNQYRYYYGCDINARAGKRQNTRKDDSHRITTYLNNMNGYYRHRDILIYTPIPASQWLSTMS